MECSLTDMSLAYQFKVCQHLYNTSGIAIQLYATLIAYLILQLIEIPQIWGDKLLDKLRYLQACMCQEISYVHWMESILSS